MIGRVGLDRNPFGQPPLQLLVLRIDTVGHNAHRCPPIDLFEPLEKRPQECLVAIDLAHIVNPERDDRFDTRQTDPLRGHQLGKRKLRVKGVAEIVQVNQTIADRRLRILTRRRSQRTNHCHRGGQCRRKDWQAESCRK